MFPSNDILPEVAFDVTRDFDPLDDDDAATLARLVPTDSEVREILDDPERTLAYMRKVQASIPDGDTALDSLIQVYEKRVERLEKERAQAIAIVAQAHVDAEEARERDRAKKKKPLPLVDRTLVKMQPHLWKIVYSMICLWGLAQLALMR